MNEITSDTVSADEPSALGWFADAAKHLSTTPLGIFGLFILLVYGIAGLTAIFDRVASQEPERLILYLFLGIFPFALLIAFCWLVSRHGPESFGPSGFKNEANFIEVVRTVRSLLAQQPEPTLETLQLVDRI